MVYVSDEKRNYAKVLHTALSALGDFDECAYAKNDITQEEYLRISDMLGSCCFLDITGMTLAEVLKDVCKVVLCDQARLLPDSMITDNSKLRKVANMFRR